MLSSLLQDLRFAVRSLVRRPLFAIIATLTLALGVGGATTIFSVVDGVLIKELPYRNASSLVSVWRAWPSWREQGLLDNIWDHIHFDLANYHSILDQATTLSDIEAHRARRMVLMGNERAEEVSVGLATAGLFELLGVYPAIGRAFAAGETLPNAANGARVAVLSHQLWADRFGMDVAVIGRSIVMSGESYEVVGVLRAEFRLVSDMITMHENGGVMDGGVRDVWIPLGQNQADCGNCLEVLARLVPGRTTVDARTEVQRLLIDGSGQPDQLARVAAYKERLTQRFATPLLVLFGAAGVLLLIACLNVAGLLAGEATQRHQEMAVRSALGAGRIRVARQLITESAVLGLIGAVVAVVLSIVATRLLLSVAPPMPRLSEVGVNLRVLAFATLTGIITGIGFGLAPTLSLVAPGSAMQSRGSTRGRRMRYLHGAAVTIQLAFTVVLLVIGALFGRSLSRLMSVEPGFEPEGLVAFAFDVTGARAANDESIRQFQNEIVRVASTIGGVRAVSLTTELPFPGGKGSRSFALEPDGRMSSIAMWHRTVLPNYHETMGIPLLAGRMLSTMDGPGAPNAIVVSQSFAEQIWPGESPLGKRIYKTGPVGEWTVVGVVGDVRHKTLGAPAEPTIYRTLSQLPSRRLYLVARTTGDAARVLTRLQESVWSQDPDTPITETGVMTSFMHDSEADDRFRAILMSTFAGLAAVLASVGIFGVTARSVSARTREIGIRAALGAQGRSLIVLAVREGAVGAGLGIGTGLIGAFWAAGLLRGLLYGVDTWDPVAFGLVATLMVLVCLVAVFIPARRAARVSVADAMGIE